MPLFHSHRTEQSTQSPCCPALSQSMHCAPCSCAEGIADREALMFVPAKKRPLVAV